MRTSSVILTMGMLTAACPAAVLGQAPEDERAAQNAAEAWLDLIDTEEYAESWNAAAPAFQEAVTTEQWAAQVANVREQVGDLQERAFQDAKPATDPPNSPPGEYMILSYNSSFANIASATETVATMKQEDGSWKVAGYFVRPG